MRFKGLTIFVTGGAGFIGSAVVRHLLRDTHARVVNIDRCSQPRVVVQRRRQP
jgi:dTDP-glucose 4,6-dehydratase